MREIWREMLWLPTQRLIRANRLAAVAAVFLLGLAVVAIICPWIAPYAPLELGTQPLAAPSASHWLGTDQLGRDIMSRVMFGCRISLTIASMGVGGALLVGVTLGMIAGYFGGWVDMIVGRATDMMFCLPDILLALVIMAILGAGFDRITLAIAIVYTPIFVRVCRGSVLSVRARPYVEAARALGIGSPGVLLRHVLPNVAGPVIVQTTLSLAFAVLTEATLSFLGLSGQTDAPSWGLMLQQGKDFMAQAWWMAVFPGIAITLTVLSFNLMGDGLRDMVARK